ncbi:MAG: class I SAM-dependent methyltransferase [Deltaproteobacteria bacterium]|nr:class I SAM-dependent methyltransferase [Deltaproteobacteria bacterium]
MAEQRQTDKKQGAFMSQYTADTAQSQPDILPVSGFALTGRIEKYWSRRAVSYGEIRRHELACDKKSLWVAEILPHLPVGGPLRILDVGTGAGFFAIVLAQLGHSVCGVDMSQAMLDEGAALAQQAGYEVTFQRMDACCLEFESASFDAVISRNLTWTLPDAAAAYREWNRVLRPGGVLLNFDADYGSVSFVDLADQHVGINDDMMLECESIRRQLPLSAQSRPEWDMYALRSAGFSACWCDTDLSPRIYTHRDETYNPVPMFALRAVK